MTAIRLVLGFVFIGAVAACGGGDGANTAAWVGHWSSSGTQSATCGASMTTSDITGVTIIVVGLEAPDSIVMTLNSCTIQPDLMGSKATTPGGDTCDLIVAGADMLVTWSQTSATLSGSKITATNTGSTGNGCSVTQQYTLTKM